MKTTLYLLLFFIVFFASLVSKANVVTVKGYVKLANGSAVANKEVRISVFLASSATPCSEEVVTTNNLGFYSKELSCTGDLRRSRIALKNCDGTDLVLEKEVPVSKVVEANFTPCQQTNGACAAKFTGEPISASSTIGAFTVQFNSNSSEVANGDNIIHRSWDFHDGTSLVQDRIDPLHTFPRPGTYEVCLVIKTARGCESRICKQIVVPAIATVSCTAKFTFERLGPKKFRFNSSSSSIETNDNIIERKWDFRDGGTSHDVAPTHEYAKAGSFEVCLSLRTAKGCESRICSVVKVEGTSSTDNAPIQITSLYPTPVHETLNVVVFSQRNNIVATVALVDAFGNVQSSKQMTLVAGYNPFTLPVNRLTAASYFIKVTTQYGTASKSFYKI